MLLLNVRAAAQTFLSVTHTHTPTFPPTKHLLTSAQTHTHTHAGVMQVCVRRTSSDGPVTIINLADASMSSASICGYLQKAGAQWTHRNEVSSCNTIIVQWGGRQRHDTNPLLSLHGHLGVHYSVIYLIHWQQEKRLAVFKFKSSSSVF